jgi:mRNA interferase RelE/StbE
MRKLDMTRDAARFVRGLDPKQFKQVMVKVFGLAQDATPADSEQLKGYDGGRVDVGEFRIVYSFDDETVNVEVIGKRNDDEVYRQLKRR